MIPRNDDNFTKCQNAAKKHNNDHSTCWISYSTYYSHSFHEAWPSPWKKVCRYHYSQNLRAHLQRSTQGAVQSSRLTYCTSKVEIDRRQQTQSAPYAEKRLPFISNCIEICSERDLKFLVTFKRGSVMFKSPRRCTEVSTLKVLMEMETSREVKMQYTLRKI